MRGGPPFAAARACDAGANDLNGQSKGALLPPLAIAGQHHLGFCAREHTRLGTMTRVSGILDQLAEVSHRDDAIDLSSDNFEASGALLIVQPHASVVCDDRNFVVRPLAQLCL